jgi:hypothetical protein
MKKLVTLSILASLLTSPVMAETHGCNGKISGKSVGAAALSLFVWPGLGQAINNQQDDKVITHAVLGLTGAFRFWSCYDALMDRQGGVWENRI